MTTAPRPLDQLSPESRAVLSLVLLQSRSYGDIAKLLRLGEADVRERAHAAAQGLVASREGPGADTRARIIDYMLGEQTVSARAETRTELESSEVARRWAAELAVALTPLAKSALPAIPEPEPSPPPPLPPPVAEIPAAAVPRNLPPAPVTPAAMPLFAPASDGERRWRPTRELPRGRLAASGLVALVAIIALVVVVATGGGNTKPTTTASVPVPSTSPPGAKGHSARTVQKLVLQATGANRNAFGAGQVIRQKDGTLLLLLQGRGLTPNSQHNAYAVWLFNNPNDARLLGFVRPGVGASGTFSSGATFPSDAFRFHALLVTLERSSLPSSPGPTVLRSPLSLS